MPTAQTIPDHYQIKYGKMFEGKLQQKTNRLAKHVTIKPNCSGRLETTEQIEPIDLDEKTSRFEKSQIHDPVTARRFMFPRSFNKLVGFDEDDGWKLGQLNVPIMEAGVELHNGAQRKMEDVLIAGINNDATVGNGQDEAMTTVTLPSSQEIAVNYVTPGDTVANTNLTIPKLRSTLKLFQTNEAFGQDADANDQACIAVSASQLESLLRYAEATSSDYVGQIQRLVDGEIDKLLGFNFVRTERLPLASDIRTCLAWVKSKVVFGTWANYESRLSIDNHSGATLYRVTASFGATRKEEKGVARIFCDETK